MHTRLTRRTAATAATMALLASAGCAAGADTHADSTHAAPERPVVTITDVESATPETPGTATPEPSGQQPTGLLEITIRDGEVVPEPGRHEVALGEEVTLRVTSDEADELHVHGYDEMVDLAPGTPGEVAFVADAPGVFEVELEESGLVLVELQVE